MKHSAAAFRFTSCSQTYWLAHWASNLCSDLYSVSENKERRKNERVEIFYVLKKSIQKSTGQLFIQIRVEGKKRTIFFDNITLIGKTSIYKGVRSITNCQPKKMWVCHFFCAIDSKVTSHDSICFTTVFHCGILGEAVWTILNSFFAINEKKMCGHIFCSLKMNFMVSKNFPGFEIESLCEKCTCECSDDFFLHFDVLNCFFYKIG